MSSLVETKWTQLVSESFTSWYDVLDSDSKDGAPFISALCNIMCKDTCSEKVWIHMKYEHVVKGKHFGQWKMYLV